MTDIVPVPALVAPAPFPTTADRSAGEYNAKAKVWADTEAAMAASLRAIAVATETNATAAQELATSASTSAGVAADHADLALDHANTASQWAQRTDAPVVDDQTSAKAWAVGGTGTGQPAAGDAKSWATKLGAPVDGVDYSAKHYAQSALNAPGTAATSTTSLAIGTGPKDLSIQPGKAFAVGQFVSIAHTPAPANYMIGQITAYDSVAGALTVDVAVTGQGAGSVFSAWTVALAAPGGVVSLDGQTGALYVKTINGVPVLGTGDIVISARYAITTTATPKTLTDREHCTVTAAGQTITLPAGPQPGMEVCITVGNFADTVVAGNGATIMELGEDMTIDKLRSTISLRFTDTWRIL